MVGKAFQAVGKAGAALHTMEDLKVYQTDLLKDLSTGGTIDEEAFSELRRATDLSFHVTKQTAHTISHSMAAIGLHGEALVVEPHGHQGEGPGIPP